ncbi:hypothetical protein [Caudoviricetes sp.]|nr:hypothetical protein [Caudoviricetes sp.]
MHAYNNILPIHMQDTLMAAAATGRFEVVDATVIELQKKHPERFHNEHTVSGRRFHHEPRQSVPNAGFVVPFPEWLTPRS